MGREVFIDMKISIYSSILLISVLKQTSKQKHQKQNQNKQKPYLPCGGVGEAQFKHPGLNKIGRKKGNEWEFRNFSLHPLPLESQLAIEFWVSDT